MAERRTVPGWGVLLGGLALFVVALLVRLYRLEAQSLWLDEGSSWQLSQASWAALAGELLNPSAGYPLYHLLLKGWMALFGDSEAALRMPSVLAGALAVPAIYLAAVELERVSPTPTHSIWYGLAAALLVLASPYAIWYSQEAKVYSLLLLSSAMVVWAVARAMRTGTRTDWALALVLGLAALWVHRLAALLLVAALWALAYHLTRSPVSSIQYPVSSDKRRWGWLTMGLAALLSLGLVLAMIGGLGGEQVAGRSAAGAGIPAGPALTLELTFVRFSLDRWPGDTPGWWLAPWVLLAAWGLARLLLDLRQQALRQRAVLLLVLLLVPLGLFLAQLVRTRLYEARYLTMIFPAWALLLAYPLSTRSQHSQHPQRIAQRVAGVFLALALVTGGMALFQPRFGLFSGDPVKEQYREALAELAARVQPDDAVVLHPAYLRPLYAYYMRRLTSDPAPEPLVFRDFWQGETTYGQREWDLERRAKLAGFTRSFLLIAPDHARTVDRPLAGDEYGLVGNFWAFSREQRTWPCGIWRFNGAHLLCQEAPEPYYTGAPSPKPATRASTRFGNDLLFLGYTLKATTPAGSGVYRAGGTLPISLFWDVTQTPLTDYSLFLHLCQDCEALPVAGEDGQPFEGYLPTSTWLPGKPARDDRAMRLPRDLAPGRYTLLLGVYDPRIASLAGRLPATGGTVQGGTRLILGSVEIVAPEATP